jgi:hypothetical protein
MGADEYELEVDAERGVVLRVAARYEGKEFSIIEAEEVVFDEVLAADTFVFVSPDGQPPASENLQDWAPQRVAVHDAARLAGFPVFVLSGMPGTWASFASVSPARERPARPPEVTLMYVADGSGGTVMVLQRPSPHGGSDARSAKRSAQWAAAHEVTRADLTVRVLDHDGSAATVQVDRDGTEIEITSADLSADDLVELATRLQLAPTAPPTI